MQHAVTTEVPRGRRDCGTWPCSSRSLEVICAHSEADPPGLPSVSRTLPSGSNLITWCPLPGNRRGAVVSDPDAALAIDVRLPGVQAHGNAGRHVAHVPANIRVLVPHNGGSPPPLEPQSELRRTSRQSHHARMGHANVDTTLNVYTQVLDG
jgi:hypothetical protein